MIMTKDNVRELNAMTGGRLSQLESLPASGMYELAATQSADEMRRSAEREDAQFFLMGMMIPAAKAAAICSLLQDESGILPTPVFMLKATGGAKTANSRTVSEASPRMAALPPHRQPDIHVKDIEIIPGRHEVKVKGRLVELTYSEFRILQTLASNPGWVFDREKIIHAVHGDGYNCTERAVDVQVTGLRKKLGVAGGLIETVRGIGYRFAA